MTPSKPRGFTLLELLVALGLLGMLMVLLAATLGLGVRGWAARGEQTVRHADLDPVRTSLAELVATGRLIHGDPGRLRLVARLPRSAKDDTLKEIVVEVEAGRLVLRHAPFVRGRTAEAQAVTVELARGIAGLDAAFFQGPSAETSGEDRPLGWRAAWALADGIPRLVRLRLVLPAGDPRAWPDLVVEPRINAAPAGGAAPGAAPADAPPAAAPAPGSRGDAGGYRRTASRAS
jgi:general secretion pathway protein J